MKYSMRHYDTEYRISQFPKMILATCTLYCDNAAQT